MTVSSAPGWCRAKLALPSSPCCGQHRSRFLARRVAAGGSAQHAGQLLDSFRFGAEQGNHRDCTFATRLLANGPLVPGVTGDLRKMRDANDLMRFPQCGQLLAQYVA